MLKQRYTSRNQRWLAAQNAGFQIGGVDIPPFAVLSPGVPIFGEFDGTYRAALPIADNQRDLWVNGPTTINANPAGGGWITASFPAYALFDPQYGIPVNGDELGSVAGSPRLRKGNTGFVAIGGTEEDYAAGRVLVMPEYCCRRGCRCGVLIYARYAAAADYAALATFYRTFLDGLGLMLDKVTYIAPADPLPANFKLSDYAVIFLIQNATYGDEVSPAHMRDWLATECGKTLVLVGGPNPKLTPENTALNAYSAAILPNSTLFLDTTNNVETLGNVHLLTTDPAPLYTYAMNSLAGVASAAKVITFPTSDVQPVAGRYVSRNYPNFVFNSDNHRGTCGLTPAGAGNGGIWNKVWLAVKPGRSATVIGTDVFVSGSAGLLDTANATLLQRIHPCYQLLAHCSDLATHQTLTVDDLAKLPNQIRLGVENVSVSCADAFPSAFLLGYINSQLVIPMTLTRQPTFPFPVSPFLAVWSATVEDGPPGTVHNVNSGVVAIDVNGCVYASRSATQPEVPNVPDVQRRPGAATITGSINQGPGIPPTVQTSWNPDSVQYSPLQVHFPDLPIVASAINPNEDDLFYGSIKIEPVGPKKL